MTTLTREDILEKDDGIVSGMDIDITIARNIARQELALKIADELDDIMIKATTCRMSWTQQNVAIIKIIKVLRSAQGEKKE